MARANLSEELEPHDRWLVSYADLVSLLFAFFVMMYAIASADQEKHARITHAIGVAFGKPAAQAVIEKPALTESLTTTLQDAARTASLRREHAQLTAIAHSIRTVLAPLVAQGQVRVTQTQRGIAVEINASVLFAPGDARISSESSKALIALAGVLKDDAHAIQVEGHTDNVPINNNAFASNWELSAVRAASVVRLLSDHGIAARRLAALGYGEHQALADNATADGRLRNRRVQLMILSLAGAPATVSEGDDARK
jgi:chemotaxis protein MotB